MAIIMLSARLGFPHQPAPYTSLPHPILQSMLQELPTPLSHQLALLLLVAIPVACASWTVTHEEVFREPREFCQEKSHKAANLPVRKFFYLFTCEYCFSHYVSILALFLFHLQLVFTGWRGYLMAWLALVWISNLYMSLFNRLRLDIKHENVSIAVEQTELKAESAGPR